MDLGVAMGDKLAVKPHPAVPVVKGLSGHGIPPQMISLLRSRRPDGMVFERNL
jgi:hypothetical protein